MTKQSFDKMLLINNKRSIYSKSVPDVIFRYKYDDKNYQGVTLGEKSTIDYDSIGNYFFINETNYSLIKKTKDYMIMVKKTNQIK